MIRITAPEDGRLVAGLALSAVGVERLLNYLLSGHIMPLTLAGLCLSAGIAILVWTGLAVRRHR